MSHGKKKKDHSAPKNAKRIGFLEGKRDSRRGSSVIKLKGIEDKTQEERALNLLNALRNLKNKVEEKKYDRRFHDIPTIEDLKKPLHKRKKKKVGKFEEAAQKARARIL